MNLATCIHCLQPEGLALKIDRKGRPYAHCRTCSTRTFHYDDRHALYGVALLQESADALLVAMRERPDLRRSADDAVQRILQVAASRSRPVGGVLAGLDITNARKVG